LREKDLGRLLRGNNEEKLVQGEVPDEAQISPFLARIDAKTPGSASNDKPKVLQALKEPFAH